MDDFLLGLRVICPVGMWPGREVEETGMYDQHAALSATALEVHLLLPWVGAPVSEGDVALLACALSSFPPSPIETQGLQPGTSLTL